jgi:serine/threonine protein kinase
MTSEWFLEVDDDGYFSGTSYEGVLGCVLPLRLKGGGKLAIKIPRLLADTIRENAFINKVAEDELAVVFRIHTRGGMGDRRNPGGGGAGLVQVFNILNRDPLRYPRAFGGGAVGEVLTQDRHAIMFSFEKGKNPRICSVLFEDGKLSVHPPGAKGAIGEFITPEAWEKLASPVADDRPSFGITTFCSKEQVGHLTTENTGGLVSAGILADTMDSVRALQAWYAGVPGIVYEWAEGTLQQAISQDKIRGWKLSQHYQMFANVSTGLRSLHSWGVIHGDIRPANIMCVGPADSPLSYKLGDYGGFAADGGHGEAPGSEGGNTMVGAGVGRSRVSPFYSPERRTGVERESADVAIVLNIPESKDYFIRLGWRTQLIDRETDKPKPEIIAQMRKDRERLLSPKPSEGTPAKRDLLRGGDRLRTRDYLFQIIRADRVEQSDGRGDVICLCEKRFARVIHDRLAVYNKEADLVDETVISLPLYIEFRQWSAATDLYGFGAVCLYSLFSTAVHRQPEPGKKGQSFNRSDRPTGQGGNKAPAPPTPSVLPEMDERSIDAMFGEMLKILESVSYFQSYWKDLEAFRSQLEKLFDNNPATTPKEARMHVCSKGADKDDETTLYDVALNAVNNIVQSAPNAKVILTHFDWNLAHFLFFMHFVMSCLHRQSHLPDMPVDSRMTGHGGSDGMHPFCVDRADSPTEPGPSSAADERLEKLMLMLNSVMFRDFCASPDEIPDFNPTSDFTIRIEVQDLRREIDAAAKSEKEHKEKVERALEKLAAKTGEMNAIEAQVEELRTVANQKDAAVTESRRTLDVSRQQVQIFKEAVRNAAKALDGRVVRMTAGKQLDNLLNVVSSDPVAAAPGPVVTGDSH